MVVGVFELWGCHPAEGGVASAASQAEQIKSTATELRRVRPGHDERSAAWSMWASGERGAGPGDDSCSLKGACRTMGKHFRC